MAAQADKATEELNAEMQELRSDLSKIADSLKRLGNSHAENAAVHLREAAGRSQEQLKRAGTAVAGQVEARPATSLALAFAGGLMVGLLLARGNA